EKDIYDVDLFQGAFIAYTARTKSEEKRKYQARWKALFALRKLMDRIDERPLGTPPVRLAGGDRALYEQMFRAEPQKYVSRPTFMTVMRRVYGFQTAPLAGHVDQAALHKLGEVYSTFDTDGCGKVDWRCLVFMFRVAMNAQATVEANLKWGFALYSSPGSFDPECDDPVSMADFKRLFNNMARFDKLGELNQVFDDAWEAVASSDDEAGRLAVAPGRGVNCRKPHKPLEINMRLLTLILQQRPLKDLLRPALRFGLRDRGTLTYAIEEAFFDPTLLALVKKKRRDDRNDVATSIFLGNTRRRAILVRIAMWKRLVRRRKRCVMLMMSIGGRFCKGNSSSAFRAVQRRAIACKASETIQRVYRGYLARLVAEFLRVLVRRVIATQAAYRGMRQRRKFLSWMSTKHLAATSVQRFFRGALGRKRARCILEASFSSGLPNSRFGYFDREMAVIDAEVERRAQLIQLEYRSRHKAASKLQRLWRTRRERRREEAEKLRRIKIHEVEAQMEQLLNREAREMEVYKRELMAWFKEQKKEQDQSRMLEEHTAKEKFKILSYRRRERDRIARETSRRKRAAAERFEEQRVEQWQMEWAEKGESRAIAHRKMLEAVLAHPDNAPEKALQKQLKAEIEAQKKIVFKMVDDVEAELEAPEALEIAKEDILLSKMQEERDRVDEEMKAAAAKYMEEEARVKADKEEKMTKFRDSVSDAAARTIQQMYYVFNANRTTQKRAKEVYTKHFDSENLAFYWHNTQIDTYLWEKPSGLGGWDVDPEDRWEVIPGSYELSYYFNPKSFVMQWSQPAGAVICKECNTHFSTRWCDRDERPYCESCYHARHFSEERPSTGPLSYKALDGAVPGSKDVLDFDYISEQPSIAVETWGTSKVVVSLGEGGPIASTTAPADGAPARDGHGNGNYCDFSDGSQSQQTELAEAIGTGSFERLDTSSGPAVPNQQAGAREEVWEVGDGSEMAEYLKSQQTFSYDSPSTTAAGAGVATRVGDGNPNTAGQASNCTAEESNRNVVDNRSSDPNAKLGPTREGSQDQPKEDGVDGVPTGRASDFGAESWGRAIPHAAVFEDVGNPDKNVEFKVEVVEYAEKGVAASLDRHAMDGFDEVGGGKNFRFSGPEEGMQGLLTADMGEYDSSTPSYGLEERCS
ncbi:unnamed protein product, partial [Hapterophycus canaliculatus]